MLVGQSKKLAALVNKSATTTPKPEPKKSAKLSEFEQALQHAQTLIDNRTQAILNQYPEGKRQSLFKLRYGSVSKIQALEIKAALQLLNIDVQNLNLRLLENRNYHGLSIS